MKNVFHIIYDGVEALDFTGPHDVFAMANLVTKNSNGATEVPFSQHTIASSKKPIKTAGCITITPDYTFEDDIPEVDIIVIPGSPGIVDICVDDPMITWIRSHYTNENQIVSICLGAFPLVVALDKKLDGHALTTHHAFIKKLEERLLALEIKASIARGARYVSNDKVLCSGGVSAGIDAAFYFLSQTEGNELARRTADVMEYNRTINWVQEG